VRCLFAMIPFVYEDSAVFVFANDDPVPMAFDSLASASGYMEAIDVEHGLYSELDRDTGLRGVVYTIDGRRVDAAAVDNVVELTITTQQDRAGLQQALRRAAQRGLIDSDPADPLLVARELLDKQWDSRWPKRPRWLDRRLHGGDAPSL
jgi:hypothetical protein